LAALPTGTAGSEHAVEMAVARLRAAVGTACVQTVVKRGYRLAVGEGAGVGAAAAGARAGAARAGSGAAVGR
ncbi:hypothetical protein, partial [Escherichia coli]|uniref:hypothetical protein n=1 Tax=Escherichia coli TaxID=562 RepID=UPI003F220CA3